MADDPHRPQVEHPLGPVLGPSASPTAPCDLSRQPAAAPSTTPHPDRPALGQVLIVRRRTRPGFVETGRSPTVQPTASRCGSTVHVRSFPWAPKAVIVGLNLAGQQRLQDARTRAVRCGWVSPSRALTMSPQNIPWASMTSRF